MPKQGRMRKSRPAWIGVLLPGTRLAAEEPATHEAKGEKPLAAAIGIGAADTGDDGHETSEEVALGSQFVRSDGDELFVLDDAGERHSRCGDQGDVGLCGRHHRDGSEPVARA